MGENGPQTTDVEQLVQEIAALKHTVEQLSEENSDLKQRVGAMA